jgi:hypothetical protein
MRWLVLACVAACSSHGAQVPDAAHSGDAPRGVDAAEPDASACPAVTMFDPGVRELAIGSDAPVNGIFDPSYVYPSGASAGAMSYSAVPDQMTIRTHLAVSSDGGATWTWVAEANTPEPATIASTDTTDCPGGTCTGNLISEVSSLVYDPTDADANAAWKLFAHRYLVGAGVALHYSIGTITLQTAPGPQGPWTAPAKWIGWNSPASYSSTGVEVNASTLAGTSDCLALTEPAAIVLPGLIDLAVGCVYLVGTTPAIRIELLRSIDHAASFASVGTLLRPADAACLVPGGSINGADLFVSGTTEYVVATPSDSAGYHGCLTFPITDPTTGTVGAPIRAIAPSSGQFSGACTFADGAGGYAIDLGFFQSTPPFRIAVPGVTTP